MNEKLRELLTSKNDLNHELPDGKWEDYLCSLATVSTLDLSPLKKVVRMQKILRYIYDNEIAPSEAREISLEDYAERVFAEGLDHE